MDQWSDILPDEDPGVVSFDPGLVPYLRGVLSWNISYGHNGLSPRWFQKRILVCLLVGFVVYVQSQQLWSGWDGQFTLPHFFLRAHTFVCNWQQPFLNDSAEGRRMTVELISWSISTKVWERNGIELATPGSAVRLAPLARHVTDCATRSWLTNGCQYVHEVLVNYLVKLAQEKVWLSRHDHNCGLGRKTTNKQKSQMIS